MNIYFPGPNLNSAYDFRADALEANRTLHVQNWLPDGLRTDGLQREWYNTEPECNGAARAQVPGSYQCDEFPNFRTVQAGRLAPPRSFLQLLEGRDNVREGAYFGNFGGRHWGLAPREEFAVVAMPKDGPNVTLSICAKGGS